MNLDGKIALITGGGTGIGAAITKRFVQEGAKVCIAGRRKEKLEETASRVPEGTVKICPGVKGSSPSGKGRSTSSFVCWL